MSLPVRYPAPANVVDYTTFLQQDVGVPASDMGYPIANPGTAPVLSQTPGGTLSAATYYAVYTYTNPSGETLASVEASLAVSANNVLVIASPPPLAGAAAWNAYVSSTSGTETLQAQGLAIGNAWQMPTSGLVSGRAVPGTNTTSASPFIPDTLQFALDVMNPVLICVSPNLSTVAIYNLAADFLINIGQDYPGQTWFADLRKQWNIGAIVTGVVSETHDESTGTSLLNPEQFKDLTLSDLQALKTPYGRFYMGFAQKYGQTLWGLT